MGHSRTLSMRLRLLSIHTAFLHEYFIMVGEATLKFGCESEGFPVTRIWFLGDIGIFTFNLKSAKGRQFSSSMETAPINKASKEETRLAASANSR